MKEKKLLIFDFDGVLVNTLPDIIASVGGALKATGVEDCTEEIISNSIGGGARKGMIKCLGPDRTHLLDAALDNFKKYYTLHCADKSFLYPGIIEILDYYYGKIPMAVATAKFRQPTLNIIKALGIEKYFDYIVSFDDVEKSKPDGECIENILDHFKCAKEDAILIGDTTTDIITGNNGGIHVCAVTYGFGKKEDIVSMNPQYVIDNIIQLKEII